MTMVTMAIVRRFDWVLLGCILVLNACGGTPRPPGDDIRDPEAAAAAYQHGVMVMDEDPETAREHFRRAVRADGDLGAAWNNLGVLAMEDGDLGVAVRALERARMLLPGDPDPRINLALALYRGGNVSGALESVTNALASAPDHLPALQTAAWIAVTEDRAPEALTQWLDRIAQHGTTRAWRRWARDERTRVAAPAGRTKGG